jgi:exodeoxyribonuclease VII large subunit
MYATSIQPDGIGALYLAYEQMKAKLEAEGLFDNIHKKELPRFPARIGVITSPTGAAVRDIINVLGRRYPLATVYLYPALVQGDGAAKTLIDGIDYFDRSGLVDTVIIGRGGGSIEDLWEFNNETLARRIFACTVPVISAVGHETDFTICDFVADKRAPTPSAAAELAVPDIRDLSLSVDALSDRSDRALVNATERARNKLERLKDSKVISDFGAVIEQLYDKVDELRKLASSSYESIISKKKLAFLTNAGKLEVLNPLSVMTRGYSVAEKNGKTVATVSDVDVGDVITVRLSDGEIGVKVESKHHKRGQNE